MESLAPNTSAEDPHLPGTSASALLPLRTKRRRKLSERYLSFFQNPQLNIPDDDSHSDNPTDSRLKNLRQSSKRSKHIGEYVSERPTKMETDTPLSPYDADREDEGHTGIAKRQRKRKKWSLPRSPSKHSRRQRSKHLSRKPADLCAEPSSSVPLQMISLNHSKTVLAAFPKTSQPGPGPGMPGIKLWDQDNRTLVPERVPSSQLGDVLRKNQNYAIYIGQDERYMKYPGGVFNFAQPTHQGLWLNELRKPPVARRVMIFDPKSAELLAPRSCPSVDKLSRLLDDLQKERGNDLRYRVFNAHYTDAHGLTQQRWNALFSVPPSPSSKVVSPRSAGRGSDAQARSAPPQDRLLPRDPSEHSHVLRQLKQIRCKEASSDPAEFQSSESNSPDGKRSQASNEPPLLKRHHSSVIFSSSSSSDLEYVELRNHRHKVDKSKQLRSIYQEMFPASSSEFEYLEKAGTLSSNASSDESDHTQQDDLAVRAGYRNDTETKCVSPASLLLLNRTPSLKLQRLYSFHESSDSEDSLCEALGQKLFDDCLALDDTNSNKSTEPAEESLRLHLKNYLPHEEPPHLEIHQHAPQRENGPFGKRATDVEKSLSIERNETGNHGFVLSRSRTSRRQLRSRSSVVRNGHCSRTNFAVDEIRDRDEALDSEPGTHSNDVPSNTSRKNSSGKRQIGTNEKLASHDAKKGETAGDDFVKALHTSHSTAAYVVETRHRESTRARRTRRKKLTGSSGLSRRQTCNPAGSPPNAVCLSEDLDASVGEPSEQNTRSRKSKDPTKYSFASEEVYLWDYRTKQRSEKSVPLAQAVKLCTRSDLTMIYDGQDLKTGDEQYKEIWSDTVAWISRKGTRPGCKRKVRVWDHCTGKLEQFCFSPRVCELQKWLRDNPNNTLFRPSLLMQYERRLPVEDAISVDSTPQSRAKQVIRDQVVARIRHLRITELREGAQRKVVLWNVLKQACEPPRDFASRSHLTRFLFLNPSLELLRGQDEVARLERSTELKLVRIAGTCPADLVRFWDTRAGKPCLRPAKNEAAEGQTVLDCIKAEPSLEVYMGQDRSEVKSVRNTTATARLSFPLSWHTLGHCGSLVHKYVYSRGWIPKYIETRKESAAHAVFWSINENAVYIEPPGAQMQSIEEYLKANGDRDLYVGQDMPAEVQVALRKWFQVLRYEPGRNSIAASPILLRFNLLPLKYRAIRFTSGEEFTTPRKPRKRQRRQRSEPLIDDDFAKPEDRASVKRQRLSLRVSRRPEDLRSHEVHESVLTEEEDDYPEKHKSAAIEVTRAQSQDTTNYEEENLDGSSGPGPCLTSSPSSSTIDDGYSESESECGSALCTGGDTTTTLPDHLADVEEHIRSATRSAKRMVCTIREAGPRVLKRELIHDVRQNLREQLILEVESVSHLLSLVKEFNSYDFASLANQLCEELQLLDVHGCFSCSADLGCAPNDLSSIRAQLENGRICTCDGVIQRFREVCAGLVQFHDGTLLHSQAGLLKFYGEELISRFQQLHAPALKKEKQMIRVFRVCERAKHIGFRTVARNRKSKYKSNLVPVGSSEPSLRVSGRQPEVTFLNYRDEKGNSVMGKRPSVRVFGFTIDTTALERKIGNIKPCHVCRKEVILSQANSMRCSNRVFGACEEVVCKECLETVFSLEVDEFRVLRDSENWFCVHCRGLCPCGSECNSQLSESRGSCWAVTCRVRFIWHGAPIHAKSVISVVTRRHRNGEYDAFPEEVPNDRFELVKDPAEKSWYADMDLHIGAYRCQVMIDNIWAAGTTFHVLPSSQPESVLTRDRGTSSAIAASVSYLRGPHLAKGNMRPKFAARSRPRGPRIRWHPVPKGPAHPVHAIRESPAEDGGTLVGTCSRTEGYDWRRAKQHATLQWIPDLKSADEPDVALHQDSTKLVLCAIDSERAHLMAMDKPPVPRPGFSHQDFLVKLNTFRYMAMLKSLWSIVTGRSSIHGIGLFTLSGYKKGDFVIEYAGDLIRTPLADIRETRYDAAGLGTYLFKINEDQIVDATVQSNRARFTNHSCDPNMVADIVHVQGRDLIVLRATREIPKYTELTFDYKFPYEEAKVQCLCNAWNCVGVMN